MYGLVVMLNYFKIQSTPIDSNSSIDLWGGFEVKGLKSPNSTHRYALLQSTYCH